MRRLGAVLLVAWASLAGCTTDPFSRWSRTDQALFTTSLACQATDYWQTEWALENGYKESNPLLGDHPSDEQLLAVKVAAGAAIWWAASEADNRTLALVATTLPCLVVIGHNYSEGARP